jgi:hypothetical protein
MGAGRKAVVTLLAVLAAGSPAWAQRSADEPETAASADTARLQRTAPPRGRQAPPRTVKPLSPAEAARRRPGRPGSFEVSAGGAWLGPGSLGSADATLTAPGTATPYRYFSTSATAKSTPGIDARATYNLSRRFAVEGGFSYSKPKVTFSISNDTENAKAEASGETMTQYFADANVLVFLPGLSFAKGRGRAFVEGGGGYLRQLHAGNFNVETGTVYNGGGGIKYYLKPRRTGMIKGFGFRVDMRAYYKVNGFSFDGANTWTVALGAGAIVAF